MNKTDPVQLTPVTAATVLALAAVLVTASLPAAVPGDEQWDNQFGWAGTTNDTCSITKHNGKLYTGGIAVGTNLTLRIWDGTHWSGLGNFTSAGYPTVYDLAFIGETLYAGGDFAAVDGLATSGLARWNGSSWGSVGFHGFALGLAADGNDLYVCGAFSTAGGQPLTNIARWDGTSWHAMGAGLGVSGDYVRTILVTNGTIYAGGAFTSSGGQPVTNVARWNGSAWVQLGNGLNGAVYSLAMKGTDLYASGSFTTSGGTAVNRVAKWDGSTWSALGTGLNNVSYLAAFKNSLCAAGSFTNANGLYASRFAVWDGNSWSAPAGLGAEAYRVYSTPTILYVGGSFVTAGGAIAGGIAGWDGTNWNVYGDSLNGVNSTVRALASDGTNIYAGGLFTAGGLAALDRIGRFDGTNWYVLGSGMRGTNSSTTVVNAIGVAGKYVYAGGVFTNAGGVTAANIARWDGTNWSPLGSGIPGTVSAIAVRSNDVFVGGSFTMSLGSSTAFNLARWDGTNWNALPFASFMGFIGIFSVNALAVDSSNLYVGGNFMARGWTDPIGSTNFAIHNGFDWVPFPVITDSNVTAIALVGTNIYLGGRFSKVNGLAANRIARWNGASWGAVGTGVSGIGNYSVSTLHSNGGCLYVGGSFANAGGTVTNVIARWDGTNWFPLGSGVARTLSTPSVLALASLKSELYVGGVFQRAGQKVAQYICRWSAGRDFDLPVHLTRPERRNGNRFYSTITCFGASRYVIEATTDFNSWTPLLTNTVSPYEFEDIQASGMPKRFYRARPKP